MNEITYDLYEYRTAIVNAAGVATIDMVGPVQPFERWEITSTQVANDGANASKMEIFNNPSRTQLVEGTYAGRLDTSDTQFRLGTSQGLWYRWSGASPNSVSTLTVRGRKMVARRG